MQSFPNALCSVGLHPSIGLRHKNRYDAFCLAADVMEPFRPLIDRQVCLWVAQEDAEGPFDSKTKNWMIGATTARYLFGREERSLFDILLRTANSLAKCVAGESQDFEIPSLLVPVVETVTTKRAVRSVRMLERSSQIAG